MPPEFKLCISDPKTGKTESVKLEGNNAIPLLGLKIGSFIDGSIVSKPGVKLMITGGSDKSGIPMIASVQGSVKKYILVNKKTNTGKTRVKMLVRGNQISEDICQINMKIVMEGSENR
ncbi:MAG: S6e family ribosomal protein [Nitrososphaerota archaeon]|nr:S6e family ribosomal protein [Nitrososphaerota archaeon]